VRHQTGHSKSLQSETAFTFNKRLYKLRWRIEAAFNRLKDFRRIATRYDRLARNYLASVCLAAALVWWI
jgi:transposase